MENKKAHTQELTKALAEIVSATNGISLVDTLALLKTSPHVMATPTLAAQVQTFQERLESFQINRTDIKELLDHPLGHAFFELFKHFPLKYRDEHIHLTGSITSDFLTPRLQKLLEGPLRQTYLDKLTQVYGHSSSAGDFQTPTGINQLIRLPENESFEHYLKILYLPKLILTSREAHAETAYHIAQTLSSKYNIGHIRLKFTLARSSTSSEEQIPGIEALSAEDVVLGLYEGFQQFRKQEPGFEFVLSPSFRKEQSFFDSTRYASRREHFLHQVEEILTLLRKYPFLTDHLLEVDTVGNEQNLYRKEHFQELKLGLRKLQAKGLQVRSHHGETWQTLRKGIQAVDNAMNIWHIDTLEHGVSLGINPNFYFHRLFQKVLELNSKSQPLTKGSNEYFEIMDFEWSQDPTARDKLIQGIPLTDKEKISFTKEKFYSAREIEHYQHDVLNRMLDKNITLTALPSSNKKLTGRIDDYKDHPFSWWEKKGVKLAVGTDNYVTLGTNFIREMLIILFSDPKDLKITKLLMVTTGENRRPYLSNLLWEMRTRF